MQKMRLALKDEGGGGRGPESYPAAQADHLNEDALQLKRLLADLQRENSHLRNSEPEGSLGHGGRTVSFSQYQSLQQQVQDLQRAVQQGSQGMLPSSGSHLLYSSQMPPPPPPRYGSHHGSGRETPMSGITTPQSTWGGADDELRRRVMAMQQENEGLRRKVRMLASN
eukprot:gb/GFBE01011016.1/.p1 GENE.gb/GFBE01011016.1/~~gb/GFBE01011016.1/.p1  ORF type:complete len:168 (+),score=38.62 gb/GFBE01011016.1/:1-504(+)